MHEMIDKYIFGQNLKIQRLKKSISQGELAGKLRIGNSTLSQYENGKRMPSYEMLVELADFFDVSTDELLGRTMIQSAHGSDSSSFEPELAVVRSILAHCPELWDILKSVSRRDENDQKRIYTIMNGILEQLKDI